MKTFLNRFKFLVPFIFFMTLLSIVSANSFRGMNDPKTTLQKEEEEGTTSSDCTPDMNVPFHSQYMEDQIIYEKLYSSQVVKKCQEGGGVVLEIGGLDGKFVSNSWFFQYGLHWTAILVEANPTMYERMIKNRPDAINIWNAICWGEKAQFQLTDMEATGGLVDEMSEANRNAAWNGDIIDVPCATLASILDQHSIRHIDVFFLDVEGAELIVLETIDWDKVQIDVLVVEMSYADLTKNDKIRMYLHGMGYKTPFSMQELCMEKSQQLGTESHGCMPNDVFIREDVWASIA